MWSRSADRYRGIGTDRANRIRERDGNVCRQCGNPGNQVDHIVNVRSGGTDDENNLQVLCTPCHTIKTQTEAAAGRRARRARLRLPQQPHPATIRRQRLTEGHPEP